MRCSWGTAHEGRGGNGQAIGSTDSDALSLADFDRLYFGVPHCATSVALQQVVDN